jgi:hypothetical protein
MATLFRCLHSRGFQLTAINCTIEHETLYCGLVVLPPGLSNFPIRVTDVDSGREIGKVVIHQDYWNRTAPTWLHSPIDDLEFEFIPSLPSS